MLELSQQDDIVDDVIQMAVIPVHPSIDCSAESTVSESSMFVMFVSCVEYIV